MHPKQHFFVTNQCSGRGAVLVSSQTGKQKVDYLENLPVIFQKTLFLFLSFWDAEIVVQHFGNLKKILELKKLPNATRGFCVCVCVCVCVRKTMQKLTLSRVLKGEVVPPFILETWCLCEMCVRCVYVCGRVSVYVRCVCVCVRAPAYVSSA